MASESVWICKPPKPERPRSDVGRLLRMAEGRSPVRRQESPGRGGLEASGYRRAQEHLRLPLANVSFHFGDDSKDGEHGLAHGSARIQPAAAV
jgi:hypothetical protein